MTNPVKHGIILTSDGGQEIACHFFIERRSDTMRKRNKKVKNTQKADVNQQEEKAVDDGYDGYYDDVLPPDIGHAKEGLDKDLVKKVTLVCIVVFVIISLCVALLYVL